MAVEDILNLLSYVNEQLQRVGRHAEHADSL
jgi:hypothetical protein